MMALSLTEATHTSSGQALTQALGGLAAPFLLVYSIRNWETNKTDCVWEHSQHPNSRPTPQPAPCYTSAAKSQVPCPALLATRVRLCRRASSFSRRPSALHALLVSTRLINHNGAVAKNLLMGCHELISVISCFAVQIDGRSIVFMVNVLVKVLMLSQSSPPTFGALH